VVDPKLIEILSPSETDDYLSRLFYLRHEWRSWTDGDINMPYYVMGATSYADARKDKKIYYKIKNYYNKILLENFSDLYEKILKELNSYIGPSELEDCLAHPGFHIMGDRDVESRLIDMNFPDTYINKRHRDHIYNYHEDLLKNKYSEVDTSENLSFTLSLKLPRNGSGLSIWSDGLLKHLESDTQFELDIKNNSFYKDKDIPEPEVVPYREGSMFLFSGNFYHQVAPLYKCYSDDMRVTLQGHAILCDNVWKWYF